MNLPNRLTLARLLLIPLFMIVASLKYPDADYVAAAIFVLASVTDGLDGYYARKRGQETMFGKLMDPLVDKILVSAALIVLVEMHHLPGWAALLIISREFAVTGLRAVAAAAGKVIPAGRLGKIKTVTQIVAVTALFLRDAPLPGMVYLGGAALIVALFYTFWSGMDYFKNTWLLFKRGGF
ncbi:MAG: CDP-diacylglycerol--glycerol-3-phosphate 3-phosphatidyltransferase [Eubacteriales bacterium]